MYAGFLEEISQLLQDNIPVNVVRLGPRDPPYVTPLIKQLLRKRNKLLLEALLYDESRTTVYQISHNQSGTK